MADFNRIDVNVSDISITDISEIVDNASELLDPLFHYKHRSQDGIVAGDTVEAFRGVVPDCIEAQKEYLKSLKIHIFFSRNECKKKCKYDTVYDTVKKTFTAADNRIRQRLEQNPDDVTALREKQELSTLLSEVLILFWEILSVNRD
jgi:hypothetical protein